MVLGGRVWVLGGELCGIAGVRVDYFQNIDDFLSFRVVALSCSFYFDLYALNYAPAALLPRAFINGNFRLKGGGLLNMGSGDETTLEYRVRLEQRDLSIIIYYLEILDKYVLLKHYMAIIPFPISMPVSFLL